MPIIIDDTEASSPSGMTYLQLANELRRRCRVSGGDMTAVTGQSEERTRLLRFINRAWMAIQRMHTDWQFMRATCACPTVEGQYSYSAIVDFGLSDFGYWAIDYEEGNTFRSYINPVVTIDIDESTVTLASHRLSNGAVVKLYTDGALPTGYTAGTGYYVVNKTDDTFQLAESSGGTALTLSGTQSGTHTVSSNNTASFVGFLTEQFLGVMNYDDWRNRYLLGSLRSTYQRPMAVAVGPANTLMAGPVCASGYTLVGDYYKAPTELSAAGDIPLLPSQFQGAIVSRAVMMFGVSESAPELYDEGKEEFDVIIREIEATQLPQLTVGGPLT
jgi:hypothetical protein